MLRIISVCLILFYSINLFAQEVLDGQVIGKADNEGIAFASVMIINTYKGVATDEFGFFTLEEFNLSGKEQVVVQRIGYYTDTISISDIWRTGVIYMEASEQNIDEVIIYPTDAFDLLQEALDKIPDNYYSEPIGQSGFYRQSIVGNQELMSLEEADFDAINMFNREPLKRSITVHNSRGFYDLTQVKELSNLLANNLDEDDKIKINENCEGVFLLNPNLKQLTDDGKGYFGEKGEKRYDYQYNGLVEKDGLIVYHITFDQEDDLKKTLFRGSLYIDTATLAFVDISVELSPQGVDFQKLLPLRYRMLAKLFGFTISIYDLSFHAEYTQYNDFWVLKEGSFYINGSVAKRNGKSIAGFYKVNYWMDDYYPKELFINKPTLFDDIPSNVDDFFIDDFWGEVQVPSMSHYETELLNRRK